MKESLYNIATEYEKAYYDYDPEMGAFWGRTDVAIDRFTDRSLNGYYGWQKKEDQFLAQLNKINKEELKGTSEYLTYQLLKQTLEGNKAARICKEELWHVDALWGWHNVLSMIADKQPVGTPENRAAALKRWNTFDKVAEDEINKLNVGLKEGYSAPKPVVERVLKQLKLIINTPTEDSPYFEFAKRDGDPEFKRQVALIVEKKINPSLKHYAQFLETVYLPAARDKIGVSALPYGNLCYAAKIQQQTTLNTPPQEIFNYGLAHMQQLEHEVMTIGQREFGLKKISDIFREVKLRSQHYFKSEQDILNYNFAALDKANAKISQWFDIVPKAPATIKPYPLHRAKTGSPGEYHPPTIDGTRPGIFYINTYEPEKRSRSDQEATLFHELIPGHHFQIALALEDNTSHNLNKYLFNSGFAEGWALYVERLADEMGLYQDDISRLGMLSNETLRSARLVVDPGIHVMNWSREQAVEYLKQHTAMNEDVVEAEVDRYIMMPGQATSYMLGKREIESLRELAKQKLADRYDIREYHNQVLKNGTVTLPMLRENIYSWLDKEKARG